MRRSDTITHHCSGVVVPDDDALRSTVNGHVVANRRNADSSCGHRRLRMVICLTVEKWISVVLNNREFPSLQQNFLPTTLGCDLLRRASLAHRPNDLCQCELVPSCANFSIDLE
jgi:hypothetical protein